MLSSTVCIILTLLQIVQQTDHKHVAPCTPLLPTVDMKLWWVQLVQALNGAAFVADRSRWLDMTTPILATLGLCHVVRHMLMLLPAVERSMKWVLVMVVQRSMEWVLVMAGSCRHACYGLDVAQRGLILNAEHCPQYYTLFLSTALSTIHEY
jgi:hypothetical protein